MIRPVGSLTKLLITRINNANDSSVTCLTRDCLKLVEMRVPIVGGGQEGPSGSQLRLFETQDIVSTNVLLY